METDVAGVRLAEQEGRKKGLGTDLPQISSFLPRSARSRRNPATSCLSQSGKISRSRSPTDPRASRGHVTRYRWRRFSESTEFQGLVDFCWFLQLGEITHNPLVMLRFSSVYCQREIYRRTCVCVCCLTFVCPRSSRS